MKRIPVDFSRPTVTPRHTGTVGEQHRAQELEITFTRTTDPAVDVIPVAPGVDVLPPGAPEPDLAPQVAAAIFLNPQPLVVVGLMAVGIGLLAAHYNAQQRRRLDGAK